MNFLKLKPFFDHVRAAPRGSYHSRTAVGIHERSEHKITLDIRSLLMISREVHAFKNRIMPTEPRERSAARSADHQQQTVSNLLKLIIISSAAGRIIHIFLMHCQDHVLHHTAGELLMNNSYKK